MLRRLTQRCGPIGLALSFLAVAPLARASFEVVDGAPIATSGRPRFAVDSGTYLGASGPVVAVALRVPYGELFFEEEGDHVHRARLDILIVLREGKRQVGGDLWPQVVEAGKASDTRARDIYFQKVATLPAEPGRFEATVTVSEPRSGRRNEVHWTLTVPDYRGEDLSLTNLFVTACADSGAASEEPAGDLPPRDWVLSHRFGEPLHPLCVMGEVYRSLEQQGRGGNARIVWRVLDDRRSVVASGESPLLPGGRAPFVIRPDFSALWLGSYLLEVTVRDGGTQARRIFPFQMDESMVSLDVNPAQSLELIRLIARSGEVDSLEHASPLERKEGWNRFWKRRDPTPDTPRNEFKEEFFERVRYANETFSVLEPGWRSDRGRVHIQYGAPDQVERHSQDMQGAPYEIWIYERLGRRFLFVDYDGFGRYELYQPGRER